MRLVDAVAYLAGSRRAILSTARAPGALAVGAILVLTGSIARNYDGASLVREWPALLHGIVVSSINALILFWLVYAGARASGAAERPRFWRGYLSFLGLFWMTAPMAWLYAVPYERFLDPVGAVHANAWTLAGVSMWRVLLITRALSVIWSAPFWRIFFIVMCFADVSIFIATLVAPVPVVDFMGGMSQSPAERELSGINFMVGFWALVSSPVWIIGAIVGASKMPVRWSVEPVPERVSMPVWIAAGAAVLMWIPALAAAQPEQRLRFRVQAMAKSGDLCGAMAEMSRHVRDDFPPYWDPPPRPSYRDRVPTMTAVREALTKGGQASWVRELYLEKSWRESTYFFSWPSRRDPDFVEKVAEYIGSIGPDDCRDGLRWHADHDEGLSEEGREVLRRYVEESGPARPTDPG